jgi:cardiolipin synthase A/B
VELLVDSGEFWPRLRGDLERAHSSVLIQTLSLEADRVGRDLFDLLHASRASDRRLLVDSFVQCVVADRFVYHPRNLLDPEFRAHRRATAAMFRRLQNAGVRMRLTNPPGPLLLRFVARNHKKIIVVDDRIAYLGGINFTDHNFGWHDVMLRLEHPAVVRLLAADFLATWDGSSRRRTAAFDGFEIHLLDGRDNAAGFAPVLDLIARARRSIFVETPYLTFPFTDWLAAARRRGVRVTVIVPEHNNWGRHRDYLAHVAMRTGIDLLLYPGRLTHLKAILVDDETLLLGSSNLEYLSYRLHHEVLALVTDPSIVADFRRRVVEPDTAQAHPCRTDGPAWVGALLQTQLRLMVAVGDILGPPAVSVEMPR